MRRAQISSEIESMKLRYAQLKAQFETAKSERDRLQTLLDRVDRSLAERIIVAADKARVPFVAELREIKSKITELRTAVLKNAKVLGATCTKTYLAVKEIGQVDMVIIDSSSMVLLPMVWFVAGLAKDRVVVCGDFRQIPSLLFKLCNRPCMMSRGIDVFSAAGLDSPHVDDARMVMLDTQYQMDEAICS